MREKIIRTKKVRVRIKFLMRLESWTIVEWHDLRVRADTYEFIQLNRGANDNPGLVVAPDLSQFFIHRCTMDITKEDSCPIPTVTQDLSVQHYYPYSYTIRFDYKLIGRVDSPSNGPASAATRWTFLQQLTRVPIGLEVSADVQRFFLPSQLVAASKVDPKVGHSERNY